MQVRAEMLCTKQVIVSTSVFLWFLGCDRPRENHAAPLDPDYVRIHAASKVRDANYTMEVTAKGGEKWYLEGPAAINMNHIRTEVTMFGCDQEDNFYLSLNVRPEYQTTVSEWSRKRLNGMCACVIDGQVHMVIELKAQLGQWIRITGFGSIAEARAVCNTIRMGGRSGSQ